MAWDNGEGPYVKKSSKTTQIEQARIRHIKEKFLAPEEVKALFKEASVSIRDYAILTTAYFHALRISEVGIIQFQDFEPEKNRIHITRLKNGYSNWYTIKEDVKKAIKKWIVLRGSELGPLFASRVSKMGINETGAANRIQLGIGSRQLDTIFKFYAEKANLPRNHWNFHTLRHTCAVNMVDLDIPMRQIQDWLGHTSMQSTLIYANVSTLTREKTAERFFNGISYTEDSVKVKEKLAIQNHKINWKLDKVRKNEYTGHITESAGGMEGKIDWKKDKRK